MATDADEATTALIAKMLAEDAGAGYGADGRYAHGGGLYDDGEEDASDDSDYGAPKRKAKAKKKGVVWRGWGGREGGRKGEACAPRSN